MLFRQGEACTIEGKKCTWPKGWGKYFISETFWPDIKHT